MFVPRAAHSRAASRQTRDVEKGITNGRRGLGLTTRPS
jgi:hypothetical protein